MKATFRSFWLVFMVMQTGVGINLISVWVKTRKTTRWRVGKHWTKMGMSLVSVHHVINLIHVIHMYSVILGVLFVEKSDISSMKYGNSLGKLESLNRRAFPFRALLVINVLLLDAVIHWSGTINFIYSSWILQQRLGMVYPGSRTLTNASKNTSLTNQWIWFWWNAW